MPPVPFEKFGSLPTVARLEVLCAGVVSRADIAYCCCITVAWHCRCIQFSLECGTTSCIRTITELVRQLRGLQIHQLNLSFSRSGIFCETKIDHGSNDNFCCQLVLHQFFSRSFCRVIPAATSSDCDASVAVVVTVGRERFLINQKYLDWKLTLGLETKMVTFAKIIKETSGRLTRCRSSPSGHLLLE